MALACRKCGKSITLIELVDADGSKHWSRLDVEPIHVERNDRGYVETVLLRNHWCDRPGESKPPTPAPRPATAAPMPPRDHEAAAGRRAASAAQIDAVPGEPEGFFDSDLPF